MTKNSGIQYDFSFVHKADSNLKYSSATDFWKSEYRKLLRYNNSAYILLPLCSVFTADAERAGLINSYIRGPYEIDVIFNPENANFKRFEEDQLRNKSFVCSENQGNNVCIRYRIPQQFVKDADLMINEGKYTDIDVKTKEQILNFFYLTREYAYGIFYANKLTGNKPDRKKWQTYLSEELGFPIEGEVWRAFILEDEKQILNT